MSKKRLPSPFAKHRRPGYITEIGSMANHTSSTRPSENPAKLNIR